MPARKRFVSYTTRTGELREHREGKHEWVFHCEVCGRVSFTRSEQARYCSNACRQKAYRERVKFKRKAQEMARWCREQRENAEQRELNLW